MVLNIVIRRHHNLPDWETRLKISLGCAKGLAHIHSASGGKFIHGNIKSSNVLLTQDLNGSISLAFLDALIINVLCFN
ncbi:hypothetical protein CerSpe_228970 [Prunus speciosa]